MNMNVILSFLVVFGWMIPAFCAASIVQRCELTYWLCWRYIVSLLFVYWDGEWMELIFHRWTKWIHWTFLMTRLLAYLLVLQSWDVCELGDCFDRSGMCKCDCFLLVWWHVTCVAMHSGMDGSSFYEVLSFKEILLTMTMTVSVKNQSNNNDIDHLALTFTCLFASTLLTVWVISMNLDSFLRRRKTLQSLLFLED